MKILENYSIRLLSLPDTDSFFQLIDRNRDRLEDFFAGTVNKNKTLEDSKKYMEEVQERIKNKAYYPFAIFDDRENKMIGFVDIKNIDWTIPKAELGLFIDRGNERKGIGTAAVKEIVRYCFEELKLLKVFLRTHPNNVHSILIAVKNGFEMEGTIRRDYKTTKGEVVDLHYYGRINEKIDEGR